MREGPIFYSRFELTLPKGARVRKTRDNEIKIETDRFTLKIIINFKGMSAVIPPKYKKYILGIDHMESHDYQISVVYEVSLKFGALFLPGGWGYYRWIESFMQSFESRFSQAKHFSSIGWDSTLTFIEFQERQKQPSSKEKEGQQAVARNG